MKTRTAAFALALCFVSALAVADSPSDAPLMVDNSDSAVVQRGKSVGAARQQYKKNDMCSPPQKASQTTSKTKHQKTQRNSAAPVQTNASQSM